MPFGLSLPVRPEGLEPSTFGTGIQRSIQLNYGRNIRFCSGRFYATEAWRTFAFAPFLRTPYQYIPTNILHSEHGPLKTSFGTEGQDLLLFRFPKSDLTVC